MRGLLAKALVSAALFVAFGPAMAYVECTGSVTAIQITGATAVANVTLRNTSTGNNDYIGFTVDTDGKVFLDRFFQAEALVKTITYRFTGGTCGTNQAHTDLIGIWTSS